MKKCKILSFTESDYPLFKQLQTTKVWEHPEIADVINDYLVKGYEVKQMFAQGGCMVVYLGKDV